jgi:phage tail-like protein
MSTPEVYTVAHVNVTIDGITDAGMNQLLFNRATPPSVTVEAPKHDFHGDQGNVQSIIASVQTVKYGTVELSQGLDKGMCMAKWLAQIQDPAKKIDEKKKHVKIDWLDQNGQTLFSWDAEKALLTGYSSAGSDPSSNAVLTVTATIDADEWKHLDSGGSPITG